jgi:outer membrane protein assembly factor BamB
MASAGPALAGLANSTWPVFQHDLQHSGRATVNGPQGPATPQIVWDFRGESRFRAAVSVGEDGTIYAGNGRNPMIAVDPDTGLRLWASDGGSGKHSGALGDRSQPAVDESGRAAMGARDNDLWVVNPDGSVHCRFHIPHDGDATVSPTIGSDGTIYIGSEALGGGYFYAMNPDCTVKWSVIPLGGALQNVSPALSQDESLVFVSIKTEAIALNTSDGSEAWRVTIADQGFGSRTPNFTPVLANDGSAIYFVSRAGLWALDPNTGEEIWLFVPPNPVGTLKQYLRSAPAIGPDGTIYLGATLNKKSSSFYALNPADGTIKWTHNHTDRGAYVNNQAAVGADGTVYVAFGRILYAFDGAGSAGNSVIKWQMLLPGKFEAGPIIGAPGVLYVGAGKSLFKITD